MKKVHFLGTGSYLPEKIITNYDLSLRLDTTDEWIVKRTGIKQRHIVSECEKTSDMATIAAERALLDAKVSSHEIDMIIVATTTPDRTFPSCAAIVQANLECINAFAFDIQAVCCGFIYALSIADKFHRSSGVKKSLVIGSESMSKILDWNDRSTCILFGDGAGAVVLEATNTDEKGIISTNLYSDGRLSGLLYTSGGISYDGFCGVVKMQGIEVFGHAIQKLISTIRKTLEDNSLTIEDIDWFIPHQANIRIIESLSNKLNIPWERIIITISEHANTSAASIPIAFNSLKKSGKLQKGNLVLFFAIGAGLTWGSCLSYI